MMPGGAGGGTYDLSRNQAESSASSANQAAGTLFIFGNAWGVSGGQYDQTARATASAAASKEGEVSAAIGGEPGASQSQPNWLLIGTVAGAAVLIAVLIINKK
jgi:hypothetical protein